MINKSTIHLSWLLSLLYDGVGAFLSRPQGGANVRSLEPPNKSFSLNAATKYTSLPAGLSPFEKSVAKSIDVQGNFRKIASVAVEQALREGVQLLELDFPTLVGGDKSKTQFDDFDNLQELNANRDWCVQLVPLFKSKMDCWLVLPDDKECELAKEEWAGQLYRKNTKFTSIRAATETTKGTYKKAWGSTIAESINKLQGGGGILADSSTLDILDANEQRLNLVCQPGNGGPVEDWINVEQLHITSQSQPMCIVNGALDKVRDGYYPGVFFPALAKTVPFYKTFESVFILKPLSDKGVYGWLFRVYGEPWQVILQTARQVTKGDTTSVTVTEAVALISDARPTYAQAIDALLKEALKQS